MELSQLYKEFLERLEQKTAEQLKAEIEKAREDSKDSRVFDDPDVIRVVRCKNCKKYGDVWHCTCDWISDPEWFCGDGDEDIE